MKLLDVTVVEDAIKLLRSIGTSYALVLVVVLELWLSLPLATESPI
jgi:hypothetical protein